MKTSIENTNCHLCESDLVLNYLPDTGPESGVCDMCGALYSYTRINETITSVEPLENIDEEQVITDYYNQTGQMACAFGHIDFTDNEYDQFITWANKNTNLIWGKTD